MYCLDTRWFCTDLLFQYTRIRLPSKNSSPSSNEHTSQHIKCWYLSFSLARIRQIISDMNSYYYCSLQVCISALVIFCLIWIKKKNPLKPFKCFWHYTCEDPDLCSLGSIINLKVITKHSTLLLHRTFLLGRVYSMVSFSCETKHESLLMKNTIVHKALFPFCLHF